MINSTIFEKAIKAYEDGEDNIGFCIHCGTDCYGIEPDAKGYYCEGCGKNEVFGIEEILLMG